LVLFNSCLNDKKKFCSNKNFGNAQVKDCLEENRNDPDFSAECKARFEEMMERRAEDFRLDVHLRELCRQDIDEICGYEKDSLDSIAGYDARVIQCLQDYKEDLQVPACKKQVKKLTMRAAEDIRFDEPLADACYEDRSRLCEGVTPGSARVIRCLQDQREELSYECRATLFDQEVRFAEDMDFKYPLKKACSSEAKMFCKDIPHGHARVIRCLQQKVDDPEMSTECKEEITRDENRSNEDYRLNYRLNMACELDIDELCADECSPFLGHACGGTVLRCLSDKKESISNDECKKEVSYFQKMEVTDFRNDVILAEACRMDVEEFCDTVEPGEGRVHACLRDNRDKISEACAAEELKLEKIESESTELQPKLSKLCSEERSVFCKNVKPGKGRVFKCLQENIAKPDFSTSCRGEVEKRQTRMQENWQLDYGVSHECLNEVNTICSEAKGRAHENAAVLLCLVKNFEQTGETCQNEMSRSVRMSLWAYKEGSHLTAACDQDVKSYCPKGNKTRGIFSIGAVGRCLSRRLAEEKALSADCKRLVSVAAPKDAAALFQSSSSSTSYLASQLASMQQVASSAQLINPQASGTSLITLTGWVALASVMALITLVAFVAYYGYKRYSGDYKPYSMVYKSGDI
jgi:Golgi apparatus protein 1